MRIYIAHDNDTLRIIAQKTKISLIALHSLNPDLSDPDIYLAGSQVRLPPVMDTVERAPSIPMCPTFPVESSKDWMRVTSLEDMQKTDYDVLIVGTGAGGGSVLWRLMQQLGGSGKRIGVLERGGLVIPTHAQNMATMDSLHLSQFKKSLSSYIPGYESAQVYAFGGRTLFWGLTSPRMSVSEIAKWQIPISEMNDYYTTAEKVMNVTGNYTKQAYFTQIVLNRLQQNGFADAVDDPIAVNLEPVSQNGVINSNPFFSSILLFAKSLNASYDLAVNARVVEVLTEQNRTTGVKVLSPDKQEYFLKARHVVLAASTFGTTQILLNSAIQGPAIGHYFTNHSRVYSGGKLNRQEFPEVLGPLRILIPGTKARPYQIQVNGLSNNWSQYQIEPLQKELFYAMAASGEVESRYDNRVFLDPADRDNDGVPSLKIHFNYSERDQIVIEKMAEGMRQANAAIQAPNPSGGNEFACLGAPGADAHEMGTCRIGDDPHTSGSDRFGQVHGIEGLYVADGSAIPTSGTANITLTIAALAIRTADAIIRRLKQ